MTDQPPKPTAIVTQTGLVPAGTANLLQFVDPERFGTAYDLSGWTVEDEIAQVVDIARNPAHRLQFAAIQYLRRIAIEVLKLSGAVRTAAASRIEDDGTRITLTTTQITSAASQARRVPLPTLTPKEPPHAPSEADSQAAPPPDPGPCTHRPPGDPSSPNPGGGPESPNTPAAPVVAAAGPDDGSELPGSPSPGGNSRNPQVSHMGAVRLLPV